MERTKVLSLRSTESISNSLDINELITGGREGIMLYKITGESDVGYITQGYFVFADTFRKIADGDAVIVKERGRNCIRFYQQQYSKPVLVGSKEFHESFGSRILGVVIGHLAVY